MAREAAKRVVTAGTGGRRGGAWWPTVVKPAQEYGAALVELRPVFADGLGEWKRAVASRAQLEGSDRVPWSKFSRRQRCAVAPTVRHGRVETWRHSNASR